MKISLVTAALILAISALIGVSRENRIKTLTTEWEELVIEADQLKIPTDPTASYSPDRARSESIRIKREEKINKFGAELIAFYHKMKDAEKSGDVDQTKFQQEIADIIGTMVELDPSELRMLVKVIAADTTVEKQNKLELIGFSTMMLASDNPESALAILLETRESLGATDRRNDHMTQMILTQYAAKDPLAAGQWLADNEEKIGKIEDHIKQSMVAAAAQKDIGIAVELLTTMKLNKEVSGFDGIARTVTIDNADQFMAALRDAAPTPEQSRSVFDALAGSPMMNDFETATKWIDSDKITDVERGEIASNLRFHGIKDEPEKWLGWISEQESTNNFSPTETTKDIIRQWTQSDFAAAGEWINGQPDGSIKNDAMHAYAETLTRHEPAAAADWAAALPPGEERNELLRDIHRSYKQKDPEAAAEFAKKHGLPVE